MALWIDLSVNDIAERVRREAFLRGKSLRQQLSARSGSPRTVFVAGVHRSGTNMLMQILEASYETDVFHENDERAFSTYMMRDLRIIRSLVTGSRAPVVVVKALHEAHKLTELLDTFAPATGFWMVRYFDDSVNSMLKRWPGIRNMIEALVEDRNAADWRGRGMTDETHAVVRAHYRPDISDATANALFWYYRNQLFFDQGLDHDPRVLAIDYEELVGGPDAQVEKIATFTGIPCTDKMRRISHSESVRKSIPPDISADVRALCDAMHRRLTLVTRRPNGAAALA